jgi:hypothetical protein
MDGAMQQPASPTVTINNHSKAEVEDTRQDEQGNTEIILRDAENVLVGRAACGKGPFARTVGGPASRRG